MPKISARFSFTLNANNEIDIEIIDFLNSFATPSERRLFIREALYDKIAETISVNPSTKIEQQLDAIITKLNSLEKVTVVTQQPPKINDDVDLTKAERGLESIWNGME